MFINNGESMTTRKTIVLATPMAENHAKRIVQVLEAKGLKNLRYVSATVNHFNDQEQLPMPSESVRGANVYVVDDLRQGVNGVNPLEAVMRLTILMNALQHAEAHEVSLVVPHLSFSRQDRKAKPREPITAQVVAKMFQICPVFKRLITVEVHADQIQGFYDRPLASISGAVILRDDILDTLTTWDVSTDDVIVVSPDAGGAKRARQFAETLGISTLIGECSKYRSEPGVVASMIYLGPKVAGKTVILYDDMVDTGGTIVSAAELLKEQGASRVIIAAAHGLLSHDKAGTAAHDKLSSAAVDKVFFTDAVDVDSQGDDRYVIVPVGDVLGDVIFETTKQGDGSLTKYC